MIRYVRINRFCAETGYTLAAVRGKIRSGVWMEGRVWRRAPDGHILIDVEGYNEWVENGNGLAIKQKSRGESPAPFDARSHRDKGKSPPPLKP